MADAAAQSTRACAVARTARRGLAQYAQFADAFVRAGFPSAPRSASRRRAVPRRARENRSARSRWRRLNSLPRQTGMLNNAAKIFHSVPLRMTPTAMPSMASGVRLSTSMILKSGFSGTSCTWCRGGAALDRDFVVEPRRPPGPSALRACGAPRADRRQDAGVAHAQALHFQEVIGARRTAAHRRQCISIFSTARAGCPRRRAISGNPIPRSGGCRAKRPPAFRWRLCGQRARQMFLRGIAASESPSRGRCPRASAEAGIRDELADHAQDFLLAFGQFFHRGLSNQTNEQETGGKLPSNRPPVSPTRN